MKPPVTQIYNYLSTYFSTFFISPPIDRKNVQCYDILKGNTIVKHKLFLVLIIAVISFSCAKEEQIIDRGSMIFTANGEDFIKEGFTDKNVWEMTFHADHIFGDINAEENSHVNTESVGFDFFNNFNKNNEVVVSQSEMKGQT